MLDLNSLKLPELFQTLTADQSLRRLIAAARDEDLGEAGDVTTASIIPAGRAVRVAGVARAPGVVAGLAALPTVLDVFDADVTVEQQSQDGRSCEAGQTLWTLAGSHQAILAIERTMLNLIGTMCGIASLTRRYVQAVEGTGAAICDTRKTAPGLRAMAKYSVRCGGGTLHRLGLYDAALYKDNHLAHLEPGQFTTAVESAIRSARAKHELRFVEVEVDSLDQLTQLVECEPGLIDTVLLDNMTPAQLRDAVALRDDRAEAMQLEASGGITLETVRQVAETGVDRISVGAITHSATCLDVGLDML